MSKTNRRHFIGGLALGSCCNLPGQSSLWAEESSKAVHIGHDKPMLKPIQADVLVVGAGASGIPAAIAAARQGAKVILLEEDFVPGGAPVDMYVALLCGGPRQSIYREMAEILNTRHDFSGKPVADFDAGNKNGCNYWYMPSAFVRTLLSMIGKEKNIQLMCGARAAGTLVNDSSRRQVQGVLVENQGGQTLPVKAAVTIDATGTGVIAEMAGCAVMYGRDGRHTFNEPFGPEAPDTTTQRCTWMYISQRLRPDAVFPREKIKGGGMVEHNLDHWAGGLWQGKQDDYKTRNAGVYLHWGASLLCKDTRDPITLTQTQLQALNIMEPDIAALEEAGYQVHLAPKLGVREVRRVVGDYILTVNDLKSGRLPDDTVALTDGGIDIHQKPPLTKEQIIIPRAGIPYRSLLAKDTDGLLVAGKSFSCTSYALGACRVQPIVAAIGQAAGTAAAMAALQKTDTRSIEIKTLQTQLRQDGLLPTV